MEQQSQGVTYQPEFDFTTLAEWARPLGGGEGAIPTAAPKREQQVFAAWKEELNWDERLAQVRDWIASGKPEIKIKKADKKREESKTPEQTVAK